jgi:hypothetical protein
MDVMPVSKTNRPVDAMSHHHQPKQNVSPCFSDRRHSKRSAAINLFLSLDMLIERTSLLAGTSIATHQSHTNSEPG